MAITAERLRQVLAYDPATGVWTWLKTGRVAGSIDKSVGYIRICVDGVKYWAHRLAWFWMKGEWPPPWPKRIDHEDTDGFNNRWGNLRIADPSSNCAIRSGFDFRHSAKGRFGDQLECEQCVYEQNDGRHGNLSVWVGHLGINQNFDALCIVSDNHPVANNVSRVPPGLSEHIQKIGGVVSAIPARCRTKNIDLLTGEGRKSRYQGRFFFGFKSSCDLLRLKVRDFLFGFGKLPFKAANLGRMARFSCILLGLSLVGGGYFGGNNQLVFAQTIDMRNDLGCTEGEKTKNAEPKPEMRPAGSAFNRIPSGPPRHDFLPWFLAIGAAFLLGFKISNWLNQRHIQRMREIWRK